MDINHRSIVCRGKKSITLFLLMFLLTSFSKPSSWEYAKIPNSLLSRIYLPAKEYKDTLAVEFSGSSEGYRMYLHLLQIPITSPNVEINYTIGNVLYKTHAHVLEGGQKLLLPSDATQQILTALSNHTAVTLSASHYKRTIEHF